ncbi:ras gtpase-activating protein [Anaeramoeba flamelloides]|uniref:Ras gtpase-activating protein n=1 Tax=Anaeramoeba flamelloides TaxID=1746091 RepID=A0AAV7YYR8_9EUKA|nr:ras gtpase-activating protein [Anaeramoeba flamelloides]
MTEEVPQIYVHIRDSDIFLQSPELETFQVILEFEKLKLKSKRKTTRVKCRINEEFVFFVKKRSSTVKLKLMSINDLTQKETCVGMIKIPLIDLSDEKPHEKTYDFVSQNKKFKGKKIGSLTVRSHFTYTQNHLFDQKREIEWRKKYKELVELLVDDNFEILFALSDVVHSGDADEVAKIIVEILQGYQPELTVGFINESIARETEITLQPQQLFRTNSMATKMMTFYSKTIGNEYLRSTLKQILTDLIKRNQSLTIDEFKLKDGESIEKNIEKLELTSEKVLNKIFNSLEFCPRQFHQICNKLYTCVGNKFSDYKEISIAGFFFLRYMGPAIISPDGYHVTDKIAVGSYRSNLILIAKVIQGVANRTELGVKNKSLKPLSKFTENHLPELDKFIKALATVPEQTENSNNQTKKNKNQKDVPKLTDFGSLILLHKHLISYIDKIDALLSKDEEEQDEEGTGSSLLSFLGGEDPVTRLAMLLNEYQKPPAATFKKLHSIQNHVLLSRKAIKITEDASDFMDQESEDVKILNKNSPFNGEARKATLVSRNLTKCIIKLYQAFLITDEENNFQILSKEKKKKGSLYYRSCDWEKLKATEKYKEFCQNTRELNAVDLKILDPFETVTFWINTLNLLYLHASVENGGGPATVYLRKEFNNYNRYFIAGATYSIDDIIHGVFRGNPKNFRGSHYFKSRDDPRRISVIQQFSPYLHFAVSYLESGTSLPYVYDVEKLETQLILVTKIFFEQHINIVHEKELQLVVPMQFKWNKSDFGKSNEKIYDFIAHVLKISNSEMSKKIIRISQVDYEIKFQNNLSPTTFNKWMKLYDKQNDLEYLNWSMKEEENKFEVKKGTLFPSFLEDNDLSINKQLKSDKKSKSEPERITNVLKKDKKSRINFFRKKSSKK